MSARISALLGEFWTARADANRHLVDGKVGGRQLEVRQKRPGTFLKNDLQSQPLMTRGTAEPRFPFSTVMTLHNVMRKNIIAPDNFRDDFRTLVSDLNVATFFMTFGFPYEII